MALSLRSSDDQQIRSLPGVISRFLQAGSTNLHALTEMNRLRLDSLVVVGRDNKLEGVVEKNEILTQLLLGIAGIDQTAPNVKLLFAIAGLKKTGADSSLEEGDVSAHSEQRVGDDTPEPAPSQLVTGTSNS